MTELSADRTSPGRALDDEHTQLRALIDSLPDFVYIKDRQGRFIVNNLAHALHLGASDPQVIHGKTDLEILPPDLAQKIYDADQDVMAKGLPISNYEEATVDSAGHTRWLSATKVPLHDDEGRIIGLAGISRDITDIKRAQEQVTAFSELARNLITASTTWETGRTIADTAKQLLGWDACFLQLYSEETNKLTPMFDIDIIDGVTVEVGEEVFGGEPAGFSLMTLKHGRQLILRSEDVDPGPAVAPFGDASRPSASLMFVPICKGTQVIGVFSIQSYTYNAYNIRDLDLLESLGRYCSGAIERIQAAEAMRQSEERYALAALGSNDGLWDWNLATKQVYFSQRWKNMLGYEDDEIGNSLDEWYIRVHPQELAALKEELQLHIEAKTKHFRFEHRMMHKDGSYGWMLCRGVATRNSAGLPIRMAGSLTDITDQRKAEEQLAQAAFYDSMTGLPNRALFLDRLDRCLARIQRHPEYRFAVLFVDLDRFKMVNDSLGHAAGDKLLQLIGERMVDNVRENDTVARMGGDEFTILLDDHKEPNQVIRAAGRLLECLSVPFIINGSEVFVGASIGLTFGTTDYESVEEILRDADTALYRAKERGKGRYEVFDQETHKSIVAFMDLESGIRHALKRKEFTVAYQPIFSLKDSKLCGFESLARWTHPQKGVIPPSTFIPVAEDTGLIIPFGEWMLDESCRQMSEWRAQFPQAGNVFISVNLSAKQFASPSLASYVEELLQRYGLAPEALHLEITETAILQQPEAVRLVLERWRKLGIRILLDDFGTGYSSLSHLQCFPLDYLKIDRSFVNTMKDTVESQAVVRAVLSLASVMNLKVVAEGAETEGQFNILRGLHCDLVQGYYMSVPVSPADAAGFLVE